MIEVIWDRGDWESSAIDMDTDEEVGFVYCQDSFWHAEVMGSDLIEEFRSQRAAEIAVEFALEQEDLLQ